MTIHLNNKKLITYHFVMTLIITLLYILIDSPSIYFITCGLIVIPMYGYIIYNESKSYEYFITPITFLFLFPLLMLGFSAVYYGFYFIENKFLALGPQRVYSDSIVSGYFISIIFFFFYHLGIELIRDKGPEKFLFRKKYKSYYNPFLLFGLLIITLIITRYEELFGFSGIFIKTIIMIPIAVLSFVALSKPSRFKLTETSYKILFFSSILILVISNVGYLAKSTIIYSFIPLFFYYINKKRYKLLIGFAVTIVPIYIFIIQPLINNARYQYWINYKQEQVTSTEILEFGLSGKFLTFNDPSQITDNQAILFVDRLFEVKATGFLYDEVEKSGFQLGSTLEYALYGLVPRIFWSDKPIISRGGWFTNYLGFRSGATGMTAPGEVYWNFGYYGIVIGGLFLGLLVGYYWKMTKSYITNNLVNMIFFITAILVTTRGAEFGSSIIALLQLIIFFIIINFFFSIIAHKN